MKNRFSILISFILLCYANYSQNIPSHYILSYKDGLPSNQIYDLHKAKSGLIYIAHSRGLSSFDGKVFKNIQDPTLPNMELSNIMEDDQGRIFCKSFNNIIFKLEGDTLSTLKFIANDNGYTVSVLRNNKIYSKGKGSIIIYHTNIKKYDTLYIKNAKTLGYLPEYNFLVSGNHSVWGIDLAGSIFSLEESIYKGKVYYSNNHFYSSVSMSLKDIFSFADQKSISIPLYGHSRLNYIVDKDSAIWFFTTEGLVYYHKTIGLPTVERYFPEFNTNDMCIAPDGSMLVSTLDQGLIIIPNIKINALSGFKPNLCFTTNDNKHLLVGNSRGQVFQCNFKTKKVTTFPLKESFGSVKYMLYNRLRNKYIIGSNKLYDYDIKTLKSYSPALKDHCEVDGNLLIGTSNGLFISKHIQSNHWVNNYTKTYNQLGDFNNSSYFGNTPVFSIKYDDVHDIIYANTHDGILKISESDTAPILLPESDFVLSDMAVYQGKILFATRNSGLMTWDGKKYLRAFPNLIPFGIFLKLLIHKDELWIVSENKVYLLKNNQVKIYDESLGIRVHPFKSLTVTDDKIYLCKDNEVLEINRNEFETQSKEPIFLLNYIRTSRGKVITENINLGHTENIIDLDFSILSVLMGDNTHLAYTINQGQVIHLATSQRRFNLDQLNPNDYELKLYIVTDNIISKKPCYSIRFTIAPPFYKSWWFISMLILLGIIASYLISQRNIRKWKEESLLKESKLLVEKELDKSILSSIKSQMNPHFIYNALNTIQSYIYSNEKGKASEYISQFSDLTRKILDFSHKEFISLHEELEAIELYLSLEKMRFEDSFDYHIKVNKSIDKEECKIPSMLIQPYIENAIKHGLLHRKMDRKLDIRVNIEETILVIEIEDNGIGRKRSMELNATKNKKHISFAINANKKRLDILKSMYGDIDYEIIDKLSPQGQALGTLIRIRLPYKFGY